jgi:hypothetical protein
MTHFPIPGKEKPTDGKKCMWKKFTFFNKNFTPIFKIEAGRRP